jgi:hypothetical protein
MSFDVSTLQSVRLLPSAQVSPICFRCGKPSSRHITRTSNRNGNGGRPYDKCMHCNKFLAFTDERGNDPNNPTCRCGLSSKRQIAGLRKKVPRGLHYVCRLGTCGFYAPVRNAEERQVTIDEGLVDGFARLGIV